MRHYPHDVLPRHALFISALMLAAWAWAEPVLAADANPAAPGAATAATARRSPFASKPLPAAALATQRGGEGVSNNAQLQGTVSNNQAANVVTGGNVISEGAFAGSAGLSTVIQNSGNNVLIQNSIIVNLQLK